MLAVAAYVKETGDRAILDAPVPYDNEPGSETPLYEHLHRSLRYTLDRLGPHGLPLIGRADWNDCLNLNAFSETPGESFQTTENKEGGVAESVFIAGLFVLAADELAALADHHGHPDDAARCRDARRTMDAAVRAHGWDGAWFRRAYDYFGDPVGAAENEEGRIFIEPQGMCVTRRHRARRRHGRARARLGGRTPGDPPRHRAPAAAPTPATTSSWARSAPTRPATRRTPASSATPTRGS